jgi:hypothetical protein
VQLLISTDAGATWQPIAGAEALPYAQGTFSWDTTTAASGSRALVRVQAVDDAAVQDTSALPFTIHNTALTYYVLAGIQVVIVALHPVVGLTALVIEGIAARGAEDIVLEHGVR